MPARTLELKALSERSLLEMKRINQNERKLLQEKVDEKDAREEETSNLKVVKPGEE